MISENSYELESFLKMVRETPALILYFSNDSCGPCQSLRVKIKELVYSHFPRMNFREIKAVEAPLIAAHFGVYSAPTLLVFFEGKEVIRENQFVAISPLQERISRYYQMVFSDRRE